MESNMNTQYKKEDVVIKFELTYGEFQDLMKRYMNREATNEEIYDIQKGVARTLPDNVETMIWEVMNNEDLV